VWATVIGVVQNIKYHPLELQPGFDVYCSYRQRPMPQMQAVVRVQGDPERMVERIRAAIQEADPQIAIVRVKTLDSLVGDLLWQQRLWGVLLGTFAAVALVLAAVGLYGVMSYLVALRTREIGIRMALGSSQSGVLRLILGQGAGLVGLGMVLGIIGSLALGWLMRSLLFGVGSSDPTTLLTTTALLMVTALAACAVPALRAARINPLQALRDE
jgi:putative ABC transport system permease protein